MIRFTLSLLFVCFVAVVWGSQSAAAAENADSLSMTDLAPSHPLYGAFQRYQVQQTVGMALLGAGFGVSLVGTGLTLGLPWGAAGIGGMTTIGVGLTSMTIGMGFLAFSRLAWQLKWRKLPGVMFYRGRESTLIGFQGRF